MRTEGCCLVRSAFSTFTTSPTPNAFFDSPKGGDEKVTPLTLRISTEWMKDLAAITRKLTGPRLHATRTDAIRVVFARGLEKLKVGVTQRQGQEVTEGDCAGLGATMM